MMPDLGAYTLEVTLAYLVSLGLIVVLAGLYWLRGRRVRQQLEDIETRRGKNG